MKNIILVFLILLYSCNKPNNTPAPVQSNNQIQAVPNNLNNWETPMVADWKLCKWYGYSQPNPAPPITSTTYTNPVDCHVLLTATSNSATTLVANTKKSESGIYTCNPTHGSWFMNEADILTLDGQELRIQLLTNDTLILTAGRAQVSYTQKYKFYK